MELAAKHSLCKLITNKKAKWTFLLREISSEDLGYFKQCEKVLKENERLVNMSKETLKKLYSKSVISACSKEQVVHSKLNSPQNLKQTCLRIESRETICKRHVSGFDHAFAFT